MAGPAGQAFGGRPALPRLLGLAAEALLWALAMGATAFVSLRWLEWQNGAAIRSIVAIYAAGGLIAYLPARFLAEWPFRRSPRFDARLAAYLLALAIGTLGLTAGIFALVYRSYYAAWHDPVLSYVWALEFAFTTASALYQFAVVGVRHYLPVGLIALFAFAWWNASKPR